jgi:pilus assembly protein CpaB
MKKVYLIATFVAIIAGIATYFFATQIEKKQTIKDQPMSQVVVAIEAIPENIVITADMVELKNYTTVSVVPGAADKTADVVGKISRYPVTQGEQMVLSKLNKVGEAQDNAALSYQLKAGEYAFTMAVDVVQGVAGFVSRGDYVDIIFTSIPQGATDFVSDLLLQDIKVLRISNYATNYASEAPKGAPITSYTEVTFSLTLEQIKVLAATMAKSGTIQLALKSITTGEQTE